MSDPTGIPASGKFDRGVPYSSVFEMIGHHTQFGRIVKVLHRAVVLHAGWEMDNEAWIVELECGRRLALTTSHGGFHLPTREDIEQVLQDALASAKSIQELLKYPDTEWRV